MLHITCNGLHKHYNIIYINYKVFHVNYSMLHINDKVTQKLLFFMLLVIYNNVTCKLNCYT